MESMLEKFFEDKNIKSLVIDGPWGCGKTYLVNKYIKSYKGKSKINYISLFGYDSIDEINSRLYYMNNKGEKLYKKFHIIPRFIDIVTLHKFSISESIENTLRLEKERYKTKDQIIIFDDAERILNLDYDKIMGYFNSLISQGCRIICIMSSDNMKTEDKEGYERFKEKVFDIAFRIDIERNAIFGEIFKEINVPNSDRKYVLLQNNIRLAQKVKTLYMDVLGHINMAKIKLFEDDTYLLYIMCLYAVLAVFGSTNIKTFIEKSKENEKTYQDELELYRNRYGDTIIKNLRLMKTIPFIKRDIDLPGTLNGIFSILDILILNDYKRIDKFFEKEKTGKYKLLNKEFYYLSDLEKTKYFKEFSNYVSNADTVWDEDSLKSLVDICRYSNIEISDTLVKDIVGKILQNVDAGLNFADTYDLLHKYTISADSNYTAADSIQLIREKIKTTYEEAYQKITIDNFNKAVKTGDYSKMIAIVSVELSKTPELLRLLLNNDFFIPDLTKTITHVKWSYCHAIANIVSNMKEKDQFINVLVSKAKQNPDNFSLMDRTLTLSNIASKGRFKSFDDICKYIVGK